MIRSLLEELPGRAGAEDGARRPRRRERVAHRLDDDPRAVRRVVVRDEIDAAEEVEPPVVVEQPGAVDREPLLRAADAAAELERALRDGRRPRPRVHARGGPRRRSSRPCRSGRSRPGPRAPSAPPSGRAGPGLLPAAPSRSGRRSGRRGRPGRRAAAARHWCRTGRTGRDAAGRKDRPARRPGSGLVKVPSGRRLWFVMVELDPGGRRPAPAIMRGIRTVRGTHGDGQVVAERGQLRSEPARPALDDGSSMSVCPFQVSTKSTE